MTWDDFERVLCWMVIDVAWQSHRPLVVSDAARAFSRRWGSSYL